MMEFLLSEMQNDDFDWLHQASQLQELRAEQVLTWSQDLNQQVYWVLDGDLNIILPHQSKENSQGVGTISGGSWIGSQPHLLIFPAMTTIQATTACQVLSINQMLLADKLAQDSGFAARFYRMQAILTSRQIQSLMKRVNLNPLILYQMNVKETSSLFAELQDYHLDWLVAVGHRQQIPDGSILQAIYRPIEALHIVLEGALSIGGILELPKSLSNVYLPIDPQRIEEVTRLSRGDVFGEMRSLQSSIVSMPMHIVQVHPLRDTEILSIPYWRIQTKLLHDVEFALYFYRTLAQLTASKYHTLLNQLGFITDLDDQAKMSDRILAKVAKAEANFEWMVQRIQSKVVVGEEIQWSFK